MALDTPIPLWLLASVTSLLALLALWLAWRARAALPRRYLGLLNKIEFPINKIEFPINKIEFPINEAKHLAWFFW